MKRKLIITEADHQQFKELIFMTSPAVDAQLREKMFDFESELDSAKIVKPAKIPADVITVGSRVELQDDDTGEIIEYSIVWPHEANPDSGGISVLSPVGMTLYGAKVGSRVKCASPGGTRQLLIRGMLFQPERATR